MAVMLVNIRNMNIGDRPNIARRSLLRGAAGAAGLGLAGCCNLRDFPEPEILPLRSGAASHEPTYLSPTCSNKLREARAPAIDVHTHFFNASDVTVKGYLEGPVAHSMPSKVLADLVRLLAPIADELGAAAPTAKEEYDELLKIERLVSGLSAERVATTLDDRMKSHRENQSIVFFKLINTQRGRPFREAYDVLQQANRQRQSVVYSGAHSRSLNENSLWQVMEANETPITAAELRTRAKPDRGTYSEGLLGFVGYMLSYRWANLRSYQKAFSTHDNALGVERVLTALVDFDRWLDCPPRSAHEDQMRLFDLISRRSGCYALPLIGYNPWTDAIDLEKSVALQRVKTAIKDYGFVGVKIYPPNGFRPDGKQPAIPNGPDPQKIQQALINLWRTCIELDVPVMAHSGESMGSDDEHNQLAGPTGWRVLAERYTSASPDRTPKVNLGHFGGDSIENTWTQQFAELMKSNGANRMYADLGYWSDLACGLMGNERCEDVRQRLKAALDTPISKHEKVVDRVMYGSDWLMLSKEPYWSNYARELQDSIAAIAPDAVEKIFHGNARKLYGQAIDRKC